MRMASRDSKKLRETNKFKIACLENVRFWEIDWSFHNVATPHSPQSGTTMLQSDVYKISIRRPQTPTNWFFIGSRIASLDINIQQRVNTVKLLIVSLISLSILSTNVYANAFLDFIDRNASLQGHDIDPSTPGTQLAEVVNRTTPPPGFVAMTSKNVYTFKSQLWAGQIIIEHPNGKFTYHPIREVPEGGIPGGSKVIEFPQKMGPPSTRNAPYTYFVSKAYLNKIGESNRDPSIPFVLSNEPNKRILSDGTCIGAACKTGFFVACSSRDGEYQFCSIPQLIAKPLAYRMVGDPVLIDTKKKSKECILDETFGSTKEGIWVKKGCKAIFAVQLGAKPDKLTIKCDGPNNGRHFCPIQGLTGTPNLINSRSDKNCKLNDTYGIEDDGVWVKDGCRAFFNVKVFR